MRTTIDIDEKLIKKVMELSHCNTKKEAVNLSLNELLRKRQLKELADMGGNYELDLTLPELLEWRQMGEHKFEIDRDLDLDNLFSKKLSR